MDIRRRLKSRNPIDPVEKPVHPKGGLKDNQPLTSENGVFVRRCAVTFRDANSPVACGRPPDHAGRRARSEGASPARTRDR